MYVVAGGLLKPYPPLAAGYPYACYPISLIPRSMLCPMFT